MQRTWKKNSHECNIRGKISGRKWYNDIGMNQSSVRCSNGTVLNLITSIFLPHFIILKHEKKITNYEATNYILVSVFLLLNTYPPGHLTYGPARVMSCLWKTFCFRSTVSVHKVARIKGEFIPNFLYAFSQHVAAADKRFLLNNSQGINTFHLHITVRHLKTA